MLPMAGNVCWIFLASGLVKVVVSETSEQLAEACVPGVIQCACLVGETVWFSVGPSIYRGAYLNGKALLSVVLECEPNVSDNIACMVCVGAVREVWTTTHEGTIRILDVFTLKQKETFSVQNRVYSMCALEMTSATPTVWLGGDDQVIVLDCRSRSLQSILPSPSPGAIVCMLCVGHGVVWTAVQSQDNLGALITWDFAE